MIKQCVVCGDDFTPRRINHTTCGSVCVRERQRLYQAVYQAEHAMKHAPKQCVVCEKDFVPPHRRQKTCGPGCSERNKLRVANIRNQKKRLSAHIARVFYCVTCGRAFNPKTRKAKVCGPSCTKHYDAGYNRRYYQSRTPGQVEKGRARDRERFKKQREKLAALKQIELETGVSL